MPWAMLENHSNGKGSVQKRSMTKRKWFILEHVTRGMQVASHEQVIFLSLGSTLEPPEELLDPIAMRATCIVPYKQFY